MYVYFYSVVHYTCYVNTFGQMKLIQIHPEPRPTPESLQDCGWVLKRFPTQFCLSSVAFSYLSYLPLSLSLSLIHTYTGRQHTIYRSPSLTFSLFKPPQICLCSRNTNIPTELIHRGGRSSLSRFPQPQRSF